MFRPHQIKRFIAKVKDIRDCTNDVREFDISVPQEFAFTPGQFLTIFFEREGQKYRRQYSIKSSPSQKGVLTILVKYVNQGPGSTYLWSKQKGDELDIMAPLGVFVIKDEQKHNPLVFFSTGTGVAPFYSMIAALLVSGHTHPITLITGYRHEILCHAEFMELTKKYPNFTYIPTLTKPQDPNYSGNRGRIQQLIPQYVKPDEETHFFICGLYEMISQTCRILKDMKIPTKNIHFERYD
ncbi:MAG: ferredoxin--NADP reductase [Candidatus Woesearchaeota archaeon]